MFKSFKKTAAAKPQQLDVCAHYFTPEGSCMFCNVPAVALLPVETKGSSAAVAERSRLPSTMTAQRTAGLNKDESWVWRAFVGGWWSLRRFLGLLSGAVSALLPLAHLYDAKIYQHAWILLVILKYVFWYYECLNTFSHLFADPLTVVVYITEVFN